ncbi:Wadjet anti-phage system protein JetD domain-containing protein, partial [Sulfuritalea sp.]|uniref:Wadjet anti-phage system protein JetD domain-containing protein n=2 Tax=Betaproteobacteria TaxID=28216 RepID=UPI001AC83754
DIDTHGFAILDQLRAHIADVESFLMDRATLLAFATHWGEEDRQTLRDLPRLNAEEGALYDDLRDNRLRRNLRLEQERIGFGWIEAALAALA